MSSQPPIGSAATTRRSFYERPLEGSAASRGLASAMDAERRALVESYRTHCLRCQVPYGQFGCTHEPPTAEQLVRTIFKIADEEEHKQRIRNAQHALRYRREAMSR